MKITDIKQYHLEFELEGSFKPTWVPGYTQRIHEAELFEIKTDEGITGVTASPSFAGGFNYIDPVKLFLLGEDPNNVEKILRKLESVNLLAPRPWHLEASLWDIIGKDAGKPVYELLGGNYRELKAYASTGELQDADKRLDYVEDRVKEGFEAVKLRFQSKDVEKDLHVARRIREEFPDLKLMIDANMGWSVRILGEETRWTHSEAIRVAKELEKLGVSNGWKSHSIGGIIGDTLVCGRKLIFQSLGGNSTMASIISENSLCTSHWMSSSPMPFCLLAC